MVQPAAHQGRSRPTLTMRAAAPAAVQVILLFSFVWLDESIGGAYAAPRLGFAGTRVGVRRSRAATAVTRLQYQQQPQPDEGSEDDDDDDDDSYENGSGTHRQQQQQQQQQQHKSGQQPPPRRRRRRRRQLEVPDSVFQQQCFASPGISQWLDDHYFQNYPLPKFTTCTSNVEWIRGGTTTSTTTTWPNHAISSTAAAAAAAGRTFATSTFASSTANTFAMGDILTISPSTLIQEQLESLAGFSVVTSQQQDTTSKSDAFAAAARTQFDWEVRRSLLQAFSTPVNTNTMQSANENNEYNFQEDEDALQDLLQRGQSNTHPLGFRLTVIPSHTKLPPQVAAAGEFQLVLVGNVQEHPIGLKELSPKSTSTSTAALSSSSSSSMHFSPDVLCRQPHHCLGTPLSDFSSPPTSEELEIVATDIQNRLRSSKVYRLWKCMRRYSTFSASVLTKNKSNDIDDKSTSSTTKAPRITTAGPGTILVHAVGSIHQYSTGDAPCLIWGLGAHLSWNSLSLENTEEEEGDHHKISSIPKAAAR